MSIALERVTVTMPTDMTAVIRQAVDEGPYASASEVIGEALREWTTRRHPMPGTLASLKADINKGLADIAAGRVEPFEVGRIIAQGEQLLAARSN